MQNWEDANSVYGVSLGPGDPELITLKGLNTLKKADRVYYPGSVFKSGEVKSYSLSILEAYELDKDKLIGFYLEMNLDRIQVQEVYQETFLKIQEDVAAGLKVAIVSEGDLSTYSSFSYLLEKLQEARLVVHLIPGITSYCLAASEKKVPLTLLNDTMTIIPRIQSTQELAEAIDRNDTIVLMKIRSVMDKVFPLFDTENLTFTYYERLGTKDQFITSDKSELEHRSIPYFSLLIIKKINTT